MWTNHVVCQFLKSDSVEEEGVFLVDDNECARISGVCHVRFAHARIPLSGVGEWSRVYLKDSENLNVWAASGPHCQPYPDWVKFRFLDFLFVKKFEKKAKSIWLFFWGFVAYLIYQKFLLLFFFFYYFWEKIVIYILFMK